MRIKDKNRGRIVDQADINLEARYRLTDIFSTAWLGYALSAVAQLSIADLITEEPRSFKEIAAKAGLHAPSLYRVLRAAAANGIFVEHPVGSFSHNDVSSLLKGNHPFSWRGMAIMWNHPSCLRGWSVFSESIKDGRSGIEHAFGKRLYEHLAETPGATKAFSDAMVSNSAHTSGSIARQFPFQDYELIMDLGGGVGTLLCAILQEHPHLRGVIYEIEELLQPAQYNIDSCNLTGRARTEAGNFLKKVPPGPDLYMIKNSLWNWQDDDCRHILSNVREASQASKGQLLIIEYVIDNENAPWSTLYDLQILNMPGGRARTMSEYEKLLCQSGFAIDSVELVEDQTLVLCVPV